MRAPLIASLLFACLIPFASAVDADASGSVPDVFDPSRARAPRPGEWLEFRLAFRADPLEHSLSPDRGEIAPTARQPQRITRDDGEFEFFVPHFEPERVWRVVPLRIEVREVEESGCNVVITFAGRTSTFFMAKGGPAGTDEPGLATDWFYDSDLSNDLTRTARIGDHSYEVEETRREAERHGFVRWFNEEIPFGIVRFATPDLDMALVGMGMGRAPAFPLEGGEAVEPPLGLLYYRHPAVGD
ncbi:MAG: hypothetical protein LUC93_05950 [Planctomycetaceae bacterium]|nr:hypothetical protein [Planctomycetaceae bacterium]